jgi:hypothetical protein
MREHAGPHVGEDLRRYQMEDRGAVGKLMRDYRWIGILTQEAESFNSFGLSPGISGLLSEAMLANKSFVDTGIVPGIAKMIEEYKLPGQPNPFASAIQASLAPFKALETFHLKPFDLPLNTTVSKAWIDQIGTLNSAGVKAILGNHLLKSTEVSLFAQSALSALPAKELMNAMELSQGYGFIAKSIAFNHSFQALFESFEGSRSAFLNLPPTLSSLPAVEFFNLTDLIRISSPGVSEESDEFVEDRAQLRREIQVDTQDALEELLHSLDPNLTLLRIGARQALKSKNPDRIRHFTISYRELFTSVLHTLAPDDEVSKWTKDPALFSHNRPTRKARMLYICRYINQEPFNDLVEKDIEAGLSALNFFNKGTHKIDVNYTPDQLAILEIRMEGTLRFLLEINKSADGASN